MLTVRTRRRGSGRVRAEANFPAREAEAHDRGRDRVRFSASERRRLSQRAAWSQTAVFLKTVRSAALRGGLIEGHTGGRLTRMPIVGKWDGRIARTAATTRQGRSAAPFFRSDGTVRGA